METLVRPLIQPILEFPDSLRGILKSRGISASELARMMAYKSRNSIFRILDGVGGESARQAFYDRLIGEDPLGLDDEERTALEQALEVSRVGAQVFLSNYAMREMLMDKADDADRLKLRVDAIVDEADPTFEKALREMEHCRIAYVTITGCCDRKIFDALRERVHRTDITCEVRIAHLIYTGEEEIVRNISAIQPLLYCDFYRPYCVEPGVWSREREAFFRQNCIYLLMLDQQGTWYRHTLVLVDKGVFVSLGKSKGDRQDPFSRYFAGDVRRMPMLKTEIPSGGQLDSYLMYTENCRKLENNRAAYTIKPDIGLSYVHPDVLLPCIDEKFWQMAGERAEEIKEKFYQVHLARWENLFTQKKTSAVIFSRKAMVRFARTGRQSDHFFAARSYTPDERVQILSKIRRAMLDRSGFCVYFFKDYFEPAVTEIGLYEGAGTLMTKPHTHYNLAGDHSEAIVTQKEFCERYKEFYVKDLLERRVLTREETLAVVDELIAIAQSAC